MNKNKINSIQFFSLIVFIISAPLNNLALIKLFNFSGATAYLSIIIASIINIPFILVFIYLYNSYPNLSLSEKVKYIFGKKIGSILNIIIILLIRIYGAILFFSLIDFIISNFLPNTPFIIVGIIFTITIIYTTTKGIEVISRLSFFILFLIIILFIISILGLIPKLDFNNFKPFLEYGLKNSINSSCFLILNNYVPVFLLLCIPKNQISDNNNKNKYLIIMYIIASLMIFFIVFFIIGTLGIDLANFYHYPEYNMLKHINLFSFLDRIENILIITRILKLFILLCFINYYITFSLNKKNYITIFSSTSILISSLFFHSNIHYNNFVHNNISKFQGILLLLIVLIFIGCIKKKRI